MCEVSKAYNVEEGTAFPQNPASAPTLSRIQTLARPGGDAAWMKDPNGDLNSVISFAGKQSTGAQAHFYMEPNVTVAVPEGPGILTLHVSTQDPADNQASAAAFLNLRPEFLKSLNLSALVPDGIKGDAGVLAAFGLMMVILVWVGWRHGRK